MSFFLSYSSKNRLLVTDLKEKLELAGITCWMDHSNIPPAEDWGEQIDNALRDCDGVIVCITPDSMASTWVTYEWAYALGWYRDPKQPRVVGVKLINVPAANIHPRLLKSELIDLTTPNGSSPEWTRLVDYLKKLQTHGVASRRVRDAERIIEESHDPETRKRAIKGLELDEDPWVTRVYVNNVRYPEIETRLQITRSLTIRLQRFNDPIDSEMVDQLIPALMESNEDWVMEPLTIALGRSGIAKAASALEEAFQRTTNQTIKSNLATALGLFADAPDIQIDFGLLVEEMQSSQNRLIVLAVAETIAKLKYPDGPRLITERLRLGDNLSNDTGARNKLFACLGQYGDEALQPLGEFLKHPLPIYRGCASEILREIKSPKAIEMLREHLPHETYQYISEPISQFLRTI